MVQFWPQLGTPERSQNPKLPCHLRISAIFQKAALACTGGFASAMSQVMILTKGEEWPEFDVPWS